MVRSIHKFHKLNVMALNLLLLGILISFFVSTDAQSVGVCYGTLGNNLPSPTNVVNLYNNNRITRMRIYAPNSMILDALARSGTNIELILDAPNHSLRDLTNENYANMWVRDNVVKYYPNVKFRYISVGNEVDPNNDSRQFVPFVLPAMRNVQNALRAAGLDGRIKVSTATYTGLLNPNSYPPSISTFRDPSFIEPIIKFLVDNKSPMLANIYPYFAYDSNPRDIKLSYALLNPGSTPASDQYQNLFDAMYDAHYAAQSRLGGANVPIVVSETGWPSDGKANATPDNARTYYSNLISHVKSNKGTPARPGGPIETYLFAMFDENDKPGLPTEQHFGVFSPNQTPKYQLSF